MRVAVIGATGNIGQLVCAQVRDGGHDVVEVSRSKGVDVYSGDGLDDALSGVDAVVDVTNTLELEPDKAADFFGTVSANLVAAEQRAGVAHHVLLSIVNVEKIPDNGHYVGKVAQEKPVRAGEVPWTILRATQFHDFAAMTAGWTEDDGTATVAPLLMKPVAPRDVAVVLAEFATSGAPQGCVEVSGPRNEDLVDLARRTYAARGQRITLVPTWDAVFGTSMSGNALLPGDEARVAATTFEEWLAAENA